MTLSHKQKEKLLPVPADHQRLNIILFQLTETKEKMTKDNKVYYDEEKDKLTIKQYYRSIDFVNDKNVIQSLTHLLQETHTNKVRYNPSEFVYPWVDLRPDGNLISIYSGKSRQAEEVIQEDYATSIKRQEEMKRIAAEDDNQLKRIEIDFKFNCEHSVPQSWFNEQEPMRGDLHHLFTCEPVCNSIRSNYPYHDFADYNPERMNTKRIEESCGKADTGLFEPEYGKGSVARAVLYFLLRYPNEIEHQHKDKVDIDLLLKWHRDFLPDLYEKHRNQAIYEIQGNRNPYIDFPWKMNQIAKIQ
ncbi:endonuclease I family protein [Virgibacillus oceani]|uniref:Endonuclease I n=1 Tax=Virgibacillus oceani TaxID=1479511 RepID=A0A917M964_9BACI|nr:endonuclease [Virgibacillus oceani]GGG83153.1 hypothetical protein GCM10011398_30910 [Virgibacillus oceani]